MFSRGMSSNLLMVSLGKQRLLLQNVPQGHMAAYNIIGKSTKGGSSKVEVQKVRVGSIPILRSRYHVFLIDEANRINGCSAIMHNS